MGMMKLAAGFGIGYVLGARAGREKYEQIVAAVQQINGHPAAQHAQDTAKTALQESADAAKAKVEQGEDTNATSAASAQPRTAQRRKATPAKQAPAADKPLS